MDVLSLVARRRRRAQTAVHVRRRSAKKRSGVQRSRLLLRVAPGRRAAPVRPDDRAAALDHAAVVHGSSAAAAEHCPVLWDATYTPVADYETTRAFYGCYDWHSAVNSAWTLVRILKTFPDLPTAPAIRQKLNDHFGATNIAGDLRVHAQTAGTFELPYGYAWLLRLQYELRSWNDSDAVRWAANIQPMATYMSERMITYLKGLPAAGSHRRPSEHRDGDGQRARLRARVRPGARGGDSRVGRAPVQARHPLQHRRRAWAERLCVAVSDGSGDHGPAHGSRRRSSPGSTHFCRRSTPRSFIRSR